MTPFEQTWPTDYCDQVEFIDDLLGFMAELDRATTSVFVYQPAEPDTATLEAAWADAVGAAYDIPPGARIFWFDSARSVVDNMYTTTYEVSGISNGTLYKSWDKRKTLDMVVLFEHYSEDDLSTTWTINPLSQAYSHLMVFVLLRQAVATVFASALRGNVVAAAYITHRTDVVGTPALTMADGAATANGWTLVPTGPPVSTASVFSYFFGMAVLPAYSQTIRDKGAIVQGANYLGAAPFAAASRQMINTLGSVNTAGAMTQLNLFNNALALKAGSRSLVYALR